MRTPPWLIFPAVALVMTLLVSCGIPLPSVYGPDSSEDVAVDLGGDGPLDLFEELDDGGADLLDEVGIDAGIDTMLDTTGGFLDPCEGDGDCDSGHCIPLGEELVCTSLCDEDECLDPSWDCVDDEGDLVCLPPCEVTDCEALGAECGAPDDGCGGQLDCGECGPNEVCGGDFACSCSFLDCNGICCAAEDTCEAGQCTTPVCVATDATCDGVDDDCDGDTDEDYVPDGSCGVGACLQNNIPSECISGVEVPCAPGTPAPSDSTCDGVDDDCDDVEDEDYLSDGSCGLGWCQESNTASTCAGGVENPCVPGDPLGTDTTCDGVDDDCDGFPDDNFVSDDDCGVGACALETTPSTCVDGAATACIPGEPLADTDLTCNGVDDDCDGATDEDYSPDGACGVGACLTSNTPSSCVDGAEIACAPGVPLGTDATCDGVDDDCDGAADDDYVPVADCGTGICNLMATASTCVDGEETACVPGAPLGADTTCDGVDDDCDGSADEDAIPPCMFGDPVTGLPVTFTTTLGLPGGVVIEGDEGTYSGTVVDLDVPAVAGEASGLVGGATSQPAAIEVVAGDPDGIHLVTCRGAVHADAPTVHAVAEVVDSEGAPVSSDTQVVFGLEGFGEADPIQGEALGSGLFAAWLTVPPPAFVGGGTGSATVSAGAASSSIPLAAIGSPPDLELAPGRVALLLPFGPMMAGEEFEVPVVVHTGGDALGLYGITAEFDNDKVALTAVTAGSAENLTAPEAGSVDLANSLGEVSFNGISMDPLAGVPQGSSVEVAVLHFMVPESIDEEAQAFFSGTVDELANTMLTDIRSAAELEIQDGSGQGDEGLITVREPTLRGIFVRPGDSVMILDNVITGEDVATPMDLTGLFEDCTLTEIEPETVTCLSLSPGVVDASGCVATAVGAGATTVFAGIGDVDGSAKLRVVAPAFPMDVEVGDTNLQYLPDLDALQETRMRVLATFEGAGLSWTLDVTEQVALSASGGVSVDQTGRVTAQSEGDGTVTVEGAQGESLGSAEFTVSDSQTVSIDHLHVMIPAHMDLSEVGSVSVATASTELSLSVTDLFTADGQEAPILVHAVLSDDGETQGGSRIDVSGHVDLVVTSTDPAVGTVSEGHVTAAGSGNATIEASLATESGGTATGSAPLRVQLPPPSGMDVVVQDHRLALGPADEAATLLGLPTKRQIQVIVHFQDGTSLDYSADPSTVYTSTSPILEVFNHGDCPTCPPGQVIASGAGAGVAAVEVAFDDPHLLSLSGTVDLEVVTHQEFVVSAWEPYTPPGEEAVAETILSFIEGTATRQKARLRAVEQFTDGSVMDLTESSSLVWEVYLPGSNDPSEDVIFVEDGIAYGIGGGSVDLVAIVGGLTSQPFGINAETGDEDILALELDYPAGPTVEGINGQETGQLRVVGLFMDGTRALLSGDDLVEGLLSFAVGAPHASVGPTGMVTAVGNGPVVFSVAVAPGIDTGFDFETPDVQLLPVNLLPDVGDVDLGEPAGLAHPDRDADAIFTMPVRVNTGGEDLGGVDVEITYDPLVLEVLDVAMGAGIPGALFSANASTPGIVYLNASPPHDSGVAGPGIEVAVLTFKAQKGGPQVTSIDGTVVAVIDVDEADIGAATPRPIVAGAGDLDPPPGGVFGDANDDGQFSVGDVLFVRKLKAGSVEPNATQLSQSDILPDGEVKVSDAYFASQALARLTHFVELSAIPVAGGHVLQAALTDRDQVPVVEGVAVRFEVSVSANLDTVDFSLPHEPTESGVVTAGSHVEGGIWETSMTGLDTPEQVGVMVIVDVLDPEDAIVWSTPFLSTPLLDPAAPFIPLLVVGECVPACDGAMCGDADSCGGLCDGTCSLEDEVCEDGACVPQGCEPLECAAMGVDCGYTLDGCGGILDCGDCEPGEICVGGACIPDSCDPACVGKSCGDDDGCGGSCYGPCPFIAQVCVDGACACMGATCDGATCGDPDGCGGLCDGDCPELNDECLDGICVCGGTICGDDCCGQDEFCEGGICVPSCTPKLCGDPGAECGEAPDGCGGTLDCGESCGVNEWCAPGFDCDCLVVECDGACCAPLEQCLDGQCGVCQPDCASKTCGDADGCGGNCLNCPGENEVCAAGECVCLPDCDGKACGESDGCGDVCEGPCPNEWGVCVDGGCVCLFGACGGTCCDKNDVCFGGTCCAPECDGASCGDGDGCGGVCDGTCTDPNAICQGGTCGCKYVECAGVCCTLGETCEAGLCA